MGNISQYKNFLNEADEKPTKEKKLMKIFISPRLLDILIKLTKMGDFQVKTVANRIINLSKTEDLFDKSYLDMVDGKNDIVSFMPANRAWRSMDFQSQEDADKEPTPDCPMWKASGRQTLSIGKLVNYLFDNFSDLAVEKFSNAFKAEISAIYIYDNFKIVTGEKIRYWYSEKNYAPGSGNLNGSCMRYDNDRQSCQHFFDIYVENPEKCGLLILTDGNDKLIGRALVWKNLRKPTEKTFMDRIYTIKQSDEELFKKYAIQNGWIYKHAQAANDNSYMENGQRIQKSIAVQLNPKQYKKYPFMDTMIYYNPGTGRLGSDAGNPVEGKRRYRLQATNGEPNPID